MIDEVLDSKVLAILALIFAMGTFIHSMMAPTVGTLAITILVMSYAGLVGVPALMKNTKD